MALFRTKKLDTFETLLIDQLEDLFDAEKQIAEALPQMAEAATNPRLKEAFKLHIETTNRQIERLEQVFRELGREPSDHSCDAMQGLIEEGEDVVSAKGEPAVKDAALIGAAQRVEHYEIAGYGTARTFARRLGNRRAADLLQETLDEEGASDKELTRIAEEEVNLEAHATSRPHERE